MYECTAKYESMYRLMYISMYDCALGQRLSDRALLVVCCDRSSVCSAKSRKLSQSSWVMLLRRFDYDVMS